MATRNEHEGEGPRVFFLTESENEMDRTKETIRIAFGACEQRRWTSLIVDLCHNQETLSTIVSWVIPLRDFGEYPEEVFEYLGEKGITTEALMRVLENESKKEQWALISVNLPQDTSKEWNEEMVRFCEDLSRDGGPAFFLISNQRYPGQERNNTHIC